MDSASLKVEWGSVSMNSASAHMTNDSSDSPDMVIGRILWLPSRAELPQNAVQQVHPKAETGNEPYDHPVVVCSRPSRTRVHFHTITSFNGRSLEQRFGRNPCTKADHKRISWYLPIWPSRYHARSHNQDIGLGFPRIRLKDGRKLCKASFINTQTVYAINCMSLRVYGSFYKGGRAEHFLDEPSTQAMLTWSKKLSMYSPGPQFRLRQGETIKPRLEEPRPKAENKSENEERTEIQPVVPPEVGAKCPFVAFLKAVGETPRTAHHELRHGSIPLGLALGLVAGVLWVVTLLLLGLHTILKYACWGIRRAVLAMQR